ncbi:histidyl-tRNA synthetase [Lishizhenia tianjinensis]|uniref:Histidine--tRNA ligase n=1 Tax=Lishizhenia tianjinensis TaxID=477690 RepID=A0A1I7AKK4_9FLAO|nr:histidine--tRNA ligase [Lishizhenia tianjinensis]SFT75462.1 histidyl-tRNA synthetase [Lishizhenia tianjinensis]
MAQKPSIPKGTRDFLPAEVEKRNYIFNTISTVFKKFGFAPIETPSFENSSTLMGKYGEEGDKLMFQILRSGNYLSKLNEGEVSPMLTNNVLDQLPLEERVNLNKITGKIAEKALRYDLTVPFARFVVQHQNDLSFPFKRYQIQPVWRADRPQHGRYQEFTQCDADVVGSESLLYEVELVQIFDEVLTNLNIPDFSIKINNRKILSGIAEITGQEDKIIDITVAIDKLDKVGEEGVIKELREKEIPEEAIEKIKPLFAMNGDNASIMAEMREMLASSEVGLKGIDELEYVFDMVDAVGLQRAKLEFDVTLARGLNYYTGAIFEVKANGVKMGSICGGGRYDDLTALFGMKDMSGVGISFGADRIYDVLNTLELFPASITKGLSVLFINFGEAEAKHCFKLVSQLRQAGIDAELYPSSAKMKKQMKYANDRGVQHVAMVGSQEIEKGIVQLKNMETGEQQELDINQLIEKLK